MTRRTLGQPLYARPAGRHHSIHDEVADIQAIRNGRQVEPIIAGWRDALSILFQVAIVLFVLVTLGGGMVLLAAATVAS